MQRVATEPPITTTTNPTAPETLQAKPHTQQHKTRNNTPGALPPIIDPVGMGLSQQRRSARINTTTIVKTFIIDKEPNSEIISMAHLLVIYQDYVNLLTNRVYADVGDMWIPDNFIPDSPTSQLPDHYDIDIKHFFETVVHPATGETITQYTKLAKDTSMRDVWQQTLGKEFGIMAQGNNKTVQKEKKCIFVMNHDKIAQMCAKGKKPTYTQVVVDFCPQKANPNQVRITAGGNLIKYVGDLTTRTTDLTTAKML